MQTQALAFDVFGTVVDWRRSIARQVREVGERLGIDADWDQFADRWREGYHAGMERVNAGRDDWKIVDEIHRERLDRLLDDYGMASGLDEIEKQALNRSWHRLDPWPDCVEGLTRLKSRFIVAALSNGNVALLTNMAKYGGLAWDCVLSAELARCYKPDPRVYQTAAQLLCLPCDQVTMVAAHSFDLRGARAAGLKTALVIRPHEFGPDGQPDLQPDPEFDWCARDLSDLADQLGC